LFIGNTLLAKETIFTPNNGLRDFSLHLSGRFFTIYGRFLSGTVVRCFLGYDLAVSVAREAAGKTRWRNEETDIVFSLTGVFQERGMTWHDFSGELLDSLVKLR